MSATKAPTRRAHWVVGEELRQAHLAAGQAEGALEHALTRQRRAQKAEQKWAQVGVAPEQVLDAGTTGREGGYRDYHLHRGPTPEELAALEDADRYARNRVEALEEERKALGPFNPDAEARAAGCPWFATGHLTLAGVRYTPGMPVPRSALEGLPARKVETITGRAGQLRKVEA
jgi:hypothetical protein